MLVSRETNEATRKRIRFVLVVKNLLGDKNTGNYTQSVDYYRFNRHGCNLSVKIHCSATSRET